MCNHQHPEGEKTKGKFAKKGDLSLPIPDKYDAGVILDNGLVEVVIERKHTGNHSYSDLLWGCITQRGDELIPPIYSEFEIHNNLIVASKKTPRSYAKGVLDFFNREIVPFSESYLEIKIENNLILYRARYENDKYGFLSRFYGAYTLQGKLICTPEERHSKYRYITDNIIAATDYFGVDESYYEIRLLNLDGDVIVEGSYFDYVADSAVDGKIEVRVSGLIGYVDITGHYILRPSYDNIEKFVDGYSIVLKKDNIDNEYRYGVINELYDEVIPCWFKSIEYDQKNRLFKTEYGYKTTDGRFVVNNNGEEVFVDKKYKYCKEFNNGIAIAVSNYGYSVKYGLIDSNSKDIVPPDYAFIRLLENGNYLFKKEIDGSSNTKYGIMNAQGEMVTKQMYDGLGKFKDGLAMISNKQSNSHSGKNYGFISMDGKEVLPPRYEFVGKQVGDYNVVMRDNTWGLFNRKQYTLNIIINASFLKLVNNEYCKINVGGTIKWSYKRIEIEDGNWGCIETTGRVLVSPKYEKIGLFANGLVAIKSDNLWGFANGNDTIVIEPKYENVFSFAEELAAVKLDGKWGFIDKEGTLVIEPQFEKGRPFSEGLAAVRQQHKWGFINKRGEIEIPFQFDGVISDFQKGESKVVGIFEVLNEWGDCDKGMGYAYIDRTGKILCSQLDYYDYSDYEDTGYHSYRKYGGYNGYDDFTIDEAFEGDPSLTWNVD